VAEDIETGKEREKKKTGKRKERNQDERKGKETAIGGKEESVGEESSGVSDCWMSVVIGMRELR
jgi:hypothetical protein